MPKRLFEQAFVGLNSTSFDSADDISADVHGAELMAGRRAPVDVTGLADTWDSFLVPNLRRWSARLNYFNNFDTSDATPPGINTILKSVLDSTATSGVAFVLRATTAVRSDSNPEWTGYVQIDGDYSITAGDVAEADRGSVNLKGLGQLSFNTSTS